MGVQFNYTACVVIFPKGRLTAKSLQADVILSIPKQCKYKHLYSDVWVYHKCPHIHTHTRTKYSFTYLKDYASLKVDPSAEDVKTDLNHSAIVALSSKHTHTHSQ